VSAVISIEQISVYRLIIRFVVYNQLISGGRLRQHLALAVIEQDLANGKFLFVQKSFRLLRSAIHPQLPRQKQTDNQGNRGGHKDELKRVAGDDAAQ